jgi:hypothetical protein
MGLALSIAAIANVRAKAQPVNLHAIIPGGAK